jgi:hypothetical protein
MGVAEQAFGTGSQKVIAHVAEVKRILGRAVRSPLNPEPIGEEGSGGAFSDAARIRA